MFKKILAILMLAASATQQAATVNSPKGLEGLGWKETSRTECITDPKNEYNLYCKIVGWSQVVIEVTSAQNGEAVYDQWHSICGLTGGKVISEWFPIPASHKRSFVVLPAWKPKEVPCREVFFTSCHANGKLQKCNKLLSAEMVKYDGNLE